MKKELRKKVYKKYDGHCAYCGTEIEYEQMQEDHFWPQCLAHRQPHLDNNRFENLMPACRKCNNFKAGMEPEIFRSELGRQVEQLIKNSTQFYRALKFGQLKITESPIVFYFERPGWLDR